MSGYKNNLNVLFVISVILAAFAYNLFILNDTDYNVNDLMAKLCNLEGISKSSSLITLVFFKRLKQIMLIYILFRAFNKEKVLWVLVIACGVFIGMMITAQTYLHGINGLILLILCFIPHYPVYIYLIKNIYNLNNFSHRDKSFWGYFFMSISIFLIGVVCESFFSIFFLKEFYQHIVMHL